MEFIQQHWGDILTIVASILAIWRVHAKGAASQSALLLVADQVEQLKGKGGEIVADKVKAREVFVSAATQVALRLAVAQVNPNTPNPSAWKKIALLVLGGLSKQFIVEKKEG